MSGWFIIRMDGKTIAEYPSNVAVMFLLPPWIHFSSMKVEYHEDEEGNIIIDIEPEEVKK